MAKGCTPRSNRWTYREELKEASNRHGSKWAHHPQVRRQLEEGESQMTDNTKCDCNCDCCECEDCVCTCGK